MAREKRMTGPQVERTRSVRYNSPLRYPGGKAKLADIVKAIFRENGLLDGAYAEAYAGGASVALTLLFEEYASRIYINDLDPAVFAFWHSVLHETEALCRLVRDTRATPRQWGLQKLIYRNAATESRLAIGFAAFFLNRTNRSGIIASAGMIGGKEQQGRWKLDARYNQIELIERITRIASYRDRIHLYNLDAIDFLARCATTLPERSLVYLDPPYYVKGQRLYASYYQDEDHAEIADLLPALPFPWLVSYDDAPEIRRIYCDYRKFCYTLRYTAAMRQHGAEVMFFSDQLVIPKRASLTLERPRSGTQHVL
jgi:DNA adenine methylase